MVGDKMAKYEKNTYLIGDDTGLRGYTNSKECAKHFIDIRKGFSIVKTKTTYKIAEATAHISEVVYFPGSTIPMLADEEQYFCEAFSDYETTLYHDLSNFCKLIMNIKFTDNEKSKLADVMSFIHEYIVSFDNQYREDRSDDSGDIWDYDECIKYFIKNVLNEK